MNWHPEKEPCKAPPFLRCGMPITPSIRSGFQHWKPHRIQPMLSPLQHSLYQVLWLCPRPLKNMRHMDPWGCLNPDPYIGPIYYNPHRTKWVVFHPLYTLNNLCRPFFTAHVYFLGRKNHHFDFGESCFSSRRTHVWKKTCLVGMPKPHRWTETVGKK